MLEIPESLTLASQLNEAVYGKTIQKVIAGHSPHKFTFYHGDPASYNKLLSGQVIGKSTGIGSMVEVSAGNRRIVLSEGVNLRYYNDSNKVPVKHQLLIEFNDGSILVVSVQMYGAIQAFIEGNNDNKYYYIAREKPSPLNDSFDLIYFNTLRTGDTNTLSVKAYLATGQRIPGLGNGVLQDVLLLARIHPKRKMETISKKEYTGLFHSVKNTLFEMTRLGGRDTEKDLFGREGGYKTLLSKNTVGKPCSICGAIIEKSSYLGGAIYWCPDCQPNLK